jgi:hypothetical protein
MRRAGGVYYSVEPLVVPGRFCGAKEETHYDLLADHFAENGCPSCQRRFSATAERLLRQVEGLEVTASRPASS